MNNNPVVQVRVTLLGDRITTRITRLPNGTLWHHITVDTPSNAPELTFQPRTVSKNWEHGNRRD